MFETTDDDDTNPTADRPRAVRVEVEYSNGDVDRAVGDDAAAIWRACMDGFAFRELHGITYRGPQMRMVPRDEQASAPPVPGPPGLTDARLAEIRGQYGRAVAQSWKWKSDRAIGDLLAEVDRLRRLEAAGAGLAEIIRGRWSFSIEATEKLAAALVAWDAARGGGEGGDDHAK